VTAAAAGIGAAIAGRFAADGAQVSVCDIDVDALDQLRSRLPDVVAETVDLADPAAVTDWCERAARRMGGVDVLVNNAGIAGPTALVEDVGIDEWRACLAVGLDSHFLTSRALAPVMKAQGSGSIIGISSTAGLVGYGRRTAYAAAKWAVIGLTKSLAIELGPHSVRVNAVCPGSVSGERMRGVIQREAQARGEPEASVTADYLTSQSIARFVDPAEIAELCAFLASPRAAMISGQAIAVDGHTETYHL
jgi:NAD(P)-dependent dehydrogenase (short-subunit alcohol dehydrogenase family)